MKPMAAAAVLMCLVSVSGCGGTQVQEKPIPAISESDDKKEWRFEADEQEKREAEENCRKILETIAPVLEEEAADASGNWAITDETAEKMLDKIENSGCTVYFSRVCGGMRRYRSMEKFLKQAKKGKPGSMLVYELCEDGGIGRNRFLFDGQELTVIYTRSTWSGTRPVIQQTECYRVKEWQYTEKGWFVYEFAVPEPPEVSERVNGTRMVRVRPLKLQYLDTARQYLFPVGYQGNNLFCSDWDSEHLEDLDYMGLYECFYHIKYRKTCSLSQYPDGIPREEFENLIQEYLPVTAEHLRRYAEFDREKQVYLWNRLGCLNYTPTAFGTSIPEITDMKEKKDGTTDITVDAVCRRTGNDCVITHVLTVECAGEGRIKFLGNQVLGEGLEQIPAYQYRR